MFLNRVMLMGNVGGEPQIRQTQDGKKVASFSLATQEGYKNKQTGEFVDKTQWHRIVVFSDGLAGIVERFVSKGSKLYVEGSLQTRKWKDKDGTEKDIAEIVLQGFNCSIQILNNSNKSENVEPNVASQPTGIEDDIPF